MVKMGYTYDPKNVKCYVQILGLALSLISQLPVLTADRVRAFYFYNSCYRISAGLQALNGSPGLNLSYQTHFSHIKIMWNLW